MSEVNKNPNLSAVLEQTAPERAAEILKKYGTLKAQMSQVTASVLFEPYGTKNATKQAFGKIEDIRGQLVAAKNPETRKALLSQFEGALASLDSTLGILSSVDSMMSPFTSKEKAPKSTVSKLLETAGFSLEKVSSVLDLYSDAEKAKIIDMVRESLEVSEQQKLRIAQIDILERMLNSFASDIKDSRSSKEWHNQFWIETGKETGDRSKYLAKSLKFLKTAKDKILQNPKATMQSVMGGFMKGISDNYGLDKNPEFAALFDSSGKIKDVNSSEELLGQYSSLVEILRWRGDYLAAQKLVEEHIFPKEFAEARSKIDKNELHTKLTRLKAKAIISVDKLIEREGGKRPPKDVRNAIIEMQYNRSLNKDVVARMNEGRPFKTTGVKSKILEQYRNMMDSGEEWFTLSDRVFDTAVREILVNVPLIMASFGAASVGKMILSGAARAMIAGSARLSRLFAGVEGISEIGTATRLSRGLFYGKEAAGALAEGTIFSATYEGLEGKNLFEGGIKNMPQWATKILWTTAALGAFKLTMTQGKAVSNTISELVTKFPDKSVAKFAQDLVVSGNMEAATMFSIGVAQHYTATGEHPEFLDILMHSYIAIGALKLTGGILTVGGKAVKPTFEFMKREMAEIGESPTMLNYMRQHGSGRMELVTAVLPLVMGAASVGHEVSAHMNRKPVATLQVEVGGKPKNIDGKFLTTDQGELFKQMEAEGMKPEQAKDIKDAYDGLPEVVKPFVKVWHLKPGEAPYVVIDEDGIKQANLMEGGVMMGMAIMAMIRFAFKWLLLKPGGAILGFAFRKGGKIAVEAGRRAVTGERGGELFDISKMPKLADILSEKELENLESPQKMELSGVINILRDALVHLGVSSQARVIELVNSIVRKRYIIIRTKQIHDTLKTVKSKNAKSKLEKELSDLQAEEVGISRVLVENDLLFIVDVNKKGRKKMEMGIDHAVESEMIKDGASRTDIETAKKAFKDLINLILSNDSVTSAMKISEIQLRINFWRSKADRSLGIVDNTRSLDPKSPLANQIKLIDDVLRSKPDKADPAVFTTPEAQDAYLRSRIFLNSFKTLLENLLKAQNDRKRWEKVIDPIRTRLPKSPGLARAARIALILALIGGAGYGGCNIISGLLGGGSGGVRKPPPELIDNPSDDPWGDDDEDPVEPPAGGESGAPAPAPASDPAPAPTPKEVPGVTPEVIPEAPAAGDQPRGDEL